MNHDYEPTEISRSIMAGLFAGLGCVLTILIYNFIYRDITGFSESGVVNISSIAFAILIFFLIAGLIFDAFHHYIKNGTTVYIVLAVIASVGTGLLALHINGKGFEGMILGIVIISGVFASLILPKLYSSNSI
ncbi:MAG: hypothetical protein ABIP68_03360 [Ferruginibacter sp.]